MFDLVNVILPVFGIIVAGYLAVRFRLFPLAGTKSLVSFVNNFATPCLLCESMLTSDFSTTFNVAIIVPFYVAALVSLIGGSLVANRVFGARPGESVSAGFSAMFTNTMLIGIAVLQRAYGPASLPIAFSIIAFHAPVLITLGMIVMELVRRDGAPLGRTAVVAITRIVQNPLLWGIAIGIVGNLLHIKVPEAGMAFLAMMGAAVLPAALFGLGGALNEYKLSESWAQASVMSAFKLIAQPGITYVLAVWVMHVPMDIARYGVLLAAMPTGINAYVFAAYYDRALNVAANVMLISTVGSIATITFWLYVLQ